MDSPGSIDYPIFCILISNNLVKKVKLKKLTILCVLKRLGSHFKNLRRVQIKIRYFYRIIE